jgi:hypothetical protein
MRVEVIRQDDGFRYRLNPGPDDPDEAIRDFMDRPDPMLLVNHEYRVVLPGVFKSIHPDAHALAIWHTIRPFIGSRLDLSFGVSTDLAEWMQRKHRILLTRTDDRQAPRRPPERVVPAMMFSGGMDSMAASLLMPPDTHHLFLDRIAHLRPHERTDSLIELTGQREACRAVQANGRPVHIVTDDHEHLFVPYPMWHANMALLPALYLADSLGLGTIDSGSVLDAKYFTGYHRGDASRWRMRKSLEVGAREDPDDLLSAAGLRRAESIGGLSEVATTIVVGRTPYREKSFSCYYPADGNFCMRCDKCFKKLLLLHIADNQEVPEQLFGHFLSIPHLAAIFRRPYFDWHHVWYYLFQKIKCRHWFVQELQRQTREGPDLSCLEKWYPKAQVEMEPAYADIVRANIDRQVGTMSAEEVDFIENVEIPPLVAPLPEEMRQPTPRVAPDRRVLAEFPYEIKALYKLLKTKLLGGPAQRWGNYRLDDVFLRPGEACVCLWLSTAPGCPTPPGGDAVVVRLFRITPEVDRFRARLGTLGLELESTGPVSDTEVRLLVGSLKKVFQEARREIE